MSDRWKRIWESKTVNDSLLTSGDFETAFMELMRIEGNDTLGNGGLPFAAFEKQYQVIKKNLCEQNGSLSSVFEVGCGGGGVLMLFQRDGIQTGGVDYSRAHIEAASKVLSQPAELYCGDASEMGTDLKYGAVFSKNVTEYFPDMMYARAVLDKMSEKAIHAVGIIGILDAEKETEYHAYRRTLIEDYDRRYAGLAKLFINRHFFVDYAAGHQMDIKITGSKLDGYWSGDFSYDVYLYK